MVTATAENPGNCVGIIVLLRKRRPGWCCTRWAPRGSVRTSGASSSSETDNEIGSGYVNLRYKKPPFASWASGRVLHLRGIRWLRGGNEDYRGWYSWYARVCEKKRKRAREERGVGRGPVLPCEKSNVCKPKIVSRITRHSLRRLTGSGSRICLDSTRVKWVHTCVRIDV